MDDAEVADGLNIAFTEIQDPRGIALQESEEYRALRLVVLIWAGC